jgi:ketosteroid isomerase-like protein
MEMTPPGRPGLVAHGDHRRRYGMGQARELMDKATEAIVRDDFEALRDIYAADVVATTPDAGTLNGVGELIEYMRALSAALTEMSYAPSARYEFDDVAIDQGEMVATHSGPMPLPDGRTIEPTGKQIRLRSIDIARVAGGKIVAHDFYFDQLDMLGQLGLVEAPAATDS